MSNKRTPPAGNRGLTTTTNKESKVADIDHSKFHPAANYFPMMGKDDYARLLADIRANGVREPILLHRDGRIIDGRNRAKASAELGITPPTETWTGTDEQILPHVVSLNLMRRHLSVGQIADIAAQVLPELEEQARKRRTEQMEGNERAAKTKVVKVPPLNRDPAPELTPVKPTPKPVSKPQPAPKSRDVAAKMFGISPTAVARAKVLREEAPELAEKVRSGEMAQGRAIKLHKQQQREAENERLVQEAKERLKISKPFTVITGDFRTALDTIPDGSIDAIITDPPYPRDYIPLLTDLSQVAARVLKPHGILAVMIGQTYLPEVYERLTEHMDYHWTLAYLTPGGQAVQQWERKINTFWKPIITLTKGKYEGAWIGDVAKSDVNDNDKNHHHWGQSVSGMTDLVTRLTKPGDHVLDPFMGAGTTGVAALQENREFTGCDIDPEHVATATRRLEMVL